jgi:hypothetical protein
MAPVTNRFDTAIRSIPVAGAIHNGAPLTQCFRAAATLFAAGAGSTEAKELRKRETRFSATLAAFRPRHEQIEGWGRR